MYGVQSSKSFLVGHRHIEIIGSSKEWNKISNNISDRTYTQVRFGWLEDRLEAKLTPFMCFLLVKSVFKLNQNLYSLPINSLGQETKEILNQIG